MNLSLQELEKDDYNIKFSDFFVYKSVVGHGSFGTVVSAFSKTDNEECAVKIIQKKNVNLEELNHLRDEAYILASLKHPNIVKFKEIKETDTKILIAMELLKGGHLKKLMSKYKQEGKWFTEFEISLLMKTLLKAIDYIHYKNIVHRDIKPENILFDDCNDFTTLKLADFGLSAQFGRSNMSKIMTQQCGTIVYMAPEQLENKIYSKPVDIYSCGIIMYMLLSKGDHPLYKPEDSMRKFIWKINNTELIFPSNTPLLAQNLFKKLADKDPSQRYSADKALIHPWITRKFNENVPLTTNEKLQSFEKEENVFKMIKALFFVNFCLKSNDLLKINDKYKKLTLDKCLEQPKDPIKDFSLENNYIETIFNTKEFPLRKKSPLKQKETLKISHYITKNINSFKEKQLKYHESSQYSKRRESESKEKEEIDQTPKKSQKTFQNLPEVEKNPVLSLQTLNFVIKKNKKSNNEKPRKRANSAAIKNKPRKKDYETLNMKKVQNSDKKIELQLLMPPSKRTFSITPMSYKYDHIKSRLMNPQKATTLEETLKKERKISQKIDFIIKKPVTLVLNPPPSVPSKGKFKLKIQRKMQNY